MKYILSIIITLLLSVQTLFAADYVTFYHTDHVGTPLAMTDSTGKVVWQADYKPFGEEHTVTNNAGNNRRFVGKEKDTESGFSYFDARYEDAKTGRFISVDPVGAVNPQNSKTNEELLGNPQRLNSYAYGLNNPYRFVDPDGRFVYGTYNQRNGTLTLHDADSNKFMNAKFFSGNMVSEPIPNGRYDILEHGGRKEFFRLESVDTPYGDDIQQRTGRNEFRLHKPGGSIGCITAVNDDGWNKTKSFIDQTSTDTVQVPSKYINPIKKHLNPTETLKRYGTIDVTGSK